MDFKVLSEDKLLTVTSDDIDGAGHLHCDTDSNTVLCYTHVSIEMTGGQSPVIEIHEKVTVVLHCHFNFTMFAGPPKT